MSETYALLVAEFLVMLLVVAALVRHYKAPSVEMTVGITTYLAWFLGFAGILLLPYDIAVALVEDREMTSLEMLWDGIYWRYDVRRYSVVRIRFIRILSMLYD